MSRFADRSAGGSVPTVRGDVPVADLGTVLMHEHVVIVDPELVINRPGWWDEKQIVTMAAERLAEARSWGVDTIVDLTVWGLGRNIPRIVEINRSVDVNIVVGTGYYVWHELPLWCKRLGADKPVDDVLAEIFVEELTAEIADTGVRAGILKCVTEQYGLTADVERVLRAVAYAHNQTGAPIATHAHAGTRRGLDQLRVFDEEGVDPTRVLIGHCGDSEDLGYLRELAGAGCYLGMDRFGMDDRLPVADRVRTVARLCEQGYANRVVLSCDYGLHHPLEQRAVDEVRPDHRYAYLMETVVPALRAEGVGDEAIDQMLRHNPSAILGPATVRGAR